MLQEPPQAIKDVLHDQVSQALARITANQINHISQDAQNGFVMMLDLPIKVAQDIDVIPLKIEEEKANPSNPDGKWSISFALSLSQLGDMQATVSLSKIILI